MQQYEQQHEAGLVALRASRNKASATVHHAVAGVSWLHGGRRPSYVTCHPTEAQEQTKDDTSGEKETGEHYMVVGRTRLCAHVWSS